MSDATAIEATARAPSYHDHEEADSSADDVNHETEHGDAQPEQGPTEADIAAGSEAGGDHPKEAV